MTQNFPERHSGYLRPPKNPEMVVDEEGNNILTHAYVVAVCEFNGQFTTPKANSQLYLHYKGKKEANRLTDVFTGRI